ncbi:DedA family protein [Paenibacillus massiliensis]|uniref:DedA family protein n=1 Tax=Paenibacillus massiliensis TaxID=225917 RepID=UPI000405E51C|nr:DedA family protein [Paenibacillus massiliensis]
MDLLSSIIEQLFEWIRGLGYFGIMLGLMIEVIPSEIVLAYGGYLVSEGQINFFIAVIFGTIGGVLAQLFIYWIGKYGGRPVLEKYGKYILIKKSHIDHADDWFNKYGTGVIFTARFIPVVRHAISIPAGIARMSVWKFILLTTLAVIPWSVLFIYLGMVLGSSWSQIDEKATPYVTPILLVALAAMIVYFLVKWLIAKNKKGSV